jgi:hypothetical protein
MIACMQRPPFPAGAEAPVVLSGISFPFGRLFRVSGQITHVLRTRAPLYSPLRVFSLDLHVLGTPPAFVLSQDQTLQLRDFDPSQLPQHRGELAWCYNLLQTRRNAWTAFQTSACYSAFKDRTHRSNRAAVIRTLATAGSRGRPCWFKTGRRMYARHSLLSRERFEEYSVALPTEGAGVLHRCLFPVKLASFLHFAGLLRGGSFYPHSGFPVKRQVRLPVPSAYEGRAM